MWFITEYLNCLFMIGDISICKINIVKFVVSVATLIQIQNYKHKIIDTPISIPNFIIIDLCNCKWSMKNNKFIYTKNIYSS